MVLVVRHQEKEIFVNKIEGKPVKIGHQYG